MPPQAVPYSVHSTTQCSCVGGILLKSRLQLLQLAEDELAVVQQGSVVLWADRRCCGAVVPSHAHIRAISSVTLSVSSPK